MNKRIKTIRKMMGLNQTEFAQLLGLSKSTISAIENGRRKITEKHINQLKKHNINPKWIKTGKGEIYLEPQSKNKEIEIFIKNLFEKDENSFQQKLIYALTQLDTSSWEALEKISKIL